MQSRAPLLAQPELRPAATLVPADELAFVGEADSNSPALWERVDGRPTLFVLNSHGGESQLSAGRRLERLAPVSLLTWSGPEPEGGVWMEAVVADEQGTWYGYYHREAAAVTCPGSSKMVPSIGAARSRDRGVTWEDLGLILEGSAGSVRCATRNHYFLGGVGDFSVALDADHRYLYLFYTQYLEPSDVGVSVARMAWAARDDPQGAVDVWNQGTWLPPHFLTVDVDGESRSGWMYPPASPIMPALRSWDSGGGTVDVFWGPSVHWNTAIDAWVMLLNRANSDTWNQEGIYISFSDRLDDPLAWSAPERLLSGGDWYPQVIGLEPLSGTDKQAGETARLFVGGRSSYTIRFGYR